MAEEQTDTATDVTTDATNVNTVEPPVVEDHAVEGDDGKSKGSKSKGSKKASKPSIELQEGVELR